VQPFASFQAAQWWWFRAFFIGIVFSLVARRFFPELMPWSEDLPRRTQGVLFLLSGILAGLALQAVWWGVHRLSSALYRKQVTR